MGIQDDSGAAPGPDVRPAPETIRKNSSIPRPLDLKAVLTDCAPEPYPAF